MKKIILLAFTSVIFTSGIVFAADNPLMDIRGKLLVESQAIKDLLPQTKDPILVNSMWCSSAMAISQLDAYFSQLGIFNTIKKQELTATAINFLVRWLKEIKATDDGNIQGLNSVTQNIEAQARLHLENLKEDYSQLNDQIGNELVKLEALRKVWVQQKPS